MISLSKGALYLLEAVGEQKKRGVPCELFLFAGWEKGLYEKAKPYQDVISHQGGVPHHELADWYADIVR